MRELSQLARLYGVQAAYYDVNHHRRPARAEALLSILKSVGAPVGSFADVPTALRERRQSLWQNPLAPVIVAWEGKPCTVRLRLPAAEWQRRPIAFHLTPEGGDTQSWICRPEEWGPAREEEVEGIPYARREMTLQRKIPRGYHRLSLEIGGRALHSLIIASPERAYGAGLPDGEWGVFLPLYALYSRRSWGAGDFGDLEALMDWVGELGGQVVGTLPLLAAFLDAPFEPSPYMPVSRVFWNEFYVDVTQAPELSRCAPAQRLLESPELQSELTGLRRQTLVDYRRVMALKRKVLEVLARAFFTSDSGRRTAFDRFIQVRPEVMDYASFRATMEQLGLPWPQWPEPLRSGPLPPGTCSEETRRYYLYAQWLAHQQLERVTRKEDSRSPGLYLDLPLGVHCFGYDVWKEREAFVLDMDVGAPPDRMFTTGQNWGFPPLHPERLRQQGYRYLRACLEHHLRHASFLRIDHVMGLHRLYWIPKGMDRTEGTYVHYPAEEIYAILVLESHRHRARIVGENLGIVPSYVNAAMSRRAVHPMYVLQYELVADARRALRPVPSGSVASLNTHDAAPFAAFWSGSDISERAKLGLLSDAEAVMERQNREKLKGSLVDFLREHGYLAVDSANAGDVARACLTYMSAERPGLVVVNLEDLWEETEAQNVPSTGSERPNWRRKARFGFEEFCQMAGILDALSQRVHTPLRQAMAQKEDRPR